MRQRQPDSSQLQQTRSLRIEDAPRNINVSDRIAIEQKIASFEVIKKGEQRNKNSDPSHAGRAAVGNGSLCSHFALAAGWVMATCSGLRGPEGPLFHGDPDICDFFRKL